MSVISACILQDMVEVHQRANDLRAQRPAASARSISVEAQPNNTAPLLRDDKARREWIEHEQSNRDQKEQDQSKRSSKE